MFLGCILGLLLVAGHAPAALAAYPDKEIRLIVPYKAGGQSDLTARKLAEVIQAKKLLPQPVIVVNIPGGNTLEGLRNAMRAAPDGYTLLLHHSAFVTMKALGQIPMSWHDFEMVGQALEMSNSLVVNRDSPFKNASEFIDAAKKTPGRYRVAIPGLGVKNTLILRNGVFAPRNTPEEVRTIVARALQQAVESEEFQVFAAQQTAQGRFLDATAWARAFAEDEKNVGEVVKFIVK